MNTHLSARDHKIKMMTNSKTNAGYISN